MSLSSTDLQKLVKLEQLQTFKNNTDNAYYHDLEWAADSNDSNKKKLFHKTKSKNAQGNWEVNSTAIVSEDTLKTDLGITALINEGGQPNTIDTVKVNGTALSPDANKAVDVLVELVEKETATAGYLKTYQLKVNNVAQQTEINIPKDFLVKSGSIVAGTWSNDTFTPGAGTGKALALVINTVGSEATDSTVYINVADLVDAYTAAANAAKVQLAISNANEISAGIVAGSIEKTDLVSAVQTTLTNADTAYGWGNHASAGYLTAADFEYADNDDINALFE